MTPLRATALAFGLAFALHVADHARRGYDASPPYVFVVGAVQGVLVAVALWMTWTQRERAPLAAIGVGVLSAFLVTSGHLLASGPDSFAAPSAVRVGWTSWASAYAELATAVAFALAGAHASVARRAGASSA